jgi:hypothetical protein
MKQIRFSHDYCKLPPFWQGTSAVLLEASHVPKDWLKGCPKFVEYDTEFRDEEGRYPLPDTDLIILFLFHSPSRRVFTTIRRCTPEKLRYYEESLLEEFALVYSPEKKDD